MKPLLRLAPLMLLVLLAGCSELLGPSASDYLDRNVSVWNSLIAKFNDWGGGSHAEQMAQALEQRRDMARFKFRLDNARSETADMRASMEKQPVPKDAGALHTKTMASLDAAVVWFDALLKLSELPDGFDAAKAQPLMEASEAAADKLDVLTDELDRLQEAYARKHNYILQSTAPQEEDSGA